MGIPDDCLQNVIDFPWWVRDDGQTLCRGRLVYVNLPHVMGEQATLEVEGRNEPTEHRKAVYSVKALRYPEVRDASVQKLPVAAIPKYHGETLLVQRAKVRPAIVLTAELMEIPRGLRMGETKHWTNPTAIVAPSYGATPDGRAAPNPELLKRFRHCEYPNYMCLWLPKTSRNGIQLEDFPSIVRLDQMQPIGTHLHNYELTTARLSERALSILNDWLVWLHTGILPEGELKFFREYLLELYATKT